MRAFTILVAVLLSTIGIVSGAKAEDCTQRTLIGTYLSSDVHYEIVGEGGANTHYNPRAVGGFSSYDGAGNVVSQSIQSSGTTVDYGASSGTYVVSAIVVGGVTTSCYVQETTTSSIGVTSTRVFYLSISGDNYYGIDTTAGKIKSFKADRVSRPPTS